MSPQLTLIHQIGKLKRLERTGWGLHGVPESESIADHVFRVASMLLLLAEDAGLDAKKCIEMALVHDLAESVIGDITPHDGISLADKSAREREAVRQLLEKDHPKLFALWEEHEAQETPEAQFVYQIDKLEAVIQADEYRKLYPNDPFDVSEFADRTRSRITHPTLVALFEEVTKGE